MSDNGTEPATELAARVAAKARDFEKSVKADDVTREGPTGNLFYITPFSQAGMGQRPGISLPRFLPPSNRYSLFNSRDLYAIAATSLAPTWANTVHIAASRAAARGWRIESATHTKKTRWHSLLMNSSAGAAFYGPTNFFMAHLKSYIKTGRALFEIEREDKGWMSRVLGIHHLSPLRCIITDNPEIPVIYLDKKGQYHELRYWEVGVLADGADLTDGEISLWESSTDRAWRKIVLEAEIETYIYERTTGTGIHRISFIQGLRDSIVQAAVSGAMHEGEAKSLYAYLGTVIQPVLGDTPLTKIDVDLAGLPEKFDYDNTMNEIKLVYCGSVGLDPNELDPRLAQARNQGSAGQSMVLDEKMKGKGLRVWEEQIEDVMNWIVLDTASKFYFREGSTRDDLEKAQLSQARANIRKTQVDMGEITVPVSRLMAVDAGDLDPKYIKGETYIKASIGDDDKEGASGKEGMNGVDVAMDNAIPPPDPPEKPPS